MQNSMMIDRTQHKRVLPIWRYLVAMVLQGHFSDSHRDVTSREAHETRNHSVESESRP